MNDWTDFKKSFTSEQESALWQYFIDHSRIQPNGYVGILFYVKDMDDFWQRLYARYTGDFARYDVIKKEAILMKYQGLASQAKKARIWDDRLQSLSDNNKILKWIFNKIAKYADNKIREKNKTKENK